MANSLTNILPKVMAAALVTVRENAVMPRLVRNYSGRIGSGVAKGKTLDIPNGVALTASAVTPATTPPANNDITPTVTSLVLDQWQKVDFHLDDQQMTQIDASDSFIPMEVGEAARALTNVVDVSLLELYKDVYSASGTVATTPFASNATAWTAARKLMIAEKAPQSGPFNLVLDPAAEQKALDLSTFQGANTRGSDSQMRTGQIGFVLGADWNVNQNIADHTPGTLTDGTGMLALVNDASYTVGESTVDIDATSLSGTVVVGDIFTVAGDAQQYVVTAGATAAANAIAGMAFAPASKVAWADNAQITFDGGATGATAHAPNLAFHPDAFAFASAPIADQMIPGLGGIMQTIVDPLSGLTFRLQVTREYMQTTWRFDVLYGVKTVRKEWASRIYG
jgi:hypothetical protein